MRLGGHVFGETGDPRAWVTELHQNGYSAAYCPLQPEADDDTVRAFEEAARAADIVISETGAWSNPLSSDGAERAAALETCRRQLDLADRIGALCCVNIAGARGTQWDGPHPANLTEETFDLIVESVRSIIDAVQPKRACYALETMPWIYPDSPQSYLRLLKAIDRPHFAVHLDVVNMINSPQRYFDNGGFIRECFALLGPYIKSCHGKDIALAGRLTVHLDEVRPGLGGLDYGTLLREMGKLGPDVPFMLEHMAPEEYPAAGAYVRAVAKDHGVTVR